MKKLTVGMILCIFLSGCLSSRSAAPAASAGSASAASTPTAAASPSAAASATAASSAAASQTIEGVLEKDLPQSLTITIQDMEIIFTKDLSYQNSSDMKPGDTIVVNYTGSLDSHPTVLSAKKK